MQGSNPRDSLPRTSARNAGTAQGGARSNTGTSARNAGTAQGGARSDTGALHAAGRTDNQPGAPADHRPTAPGQRPDTGRARKAARTSARDVRTTARDVLDSAAEHLGGSARSARKALWHLRNGGIAEVREYSRRRKAAARTAVRGLNRRKVRKGELSFPEWPIPDPADRTPNHDLTVGVIVDEFTALALQYEWRSVVLTPGRWEEQLAQTPIDLLFVESAWHGNDDAWRYMVVGGNTPTPKLRALVQHCREAGIPTVFWNKEDPVHYDEAIATARLFDHVFTTDETLLEQYRQDLGHERVGVLPFAAQPAIHNPVKLTYEDGALEPLRDIAFAGMYFAHKYPERREQMDVLLGAAMDASPKLEYGLDIFSRFLDGDPNYQFPAPFDKQVRGSLPYAEMLSAYRAYKTFINVNSVVTSPSMFARRIFEITACNTPVLTMPTPAIQRFLPPGTVAAVEDREQAALTIRALAGNADLRDRMTYLAQREIWLNHTYAHRVDTVLDAVGLGEKKHRMPVVAPLISTIRPHQLDHVVSTLAKQQHVEMTPVVLTHGFTAAAQVQERAAALGLDVTWVAGDAGASLGENYNLMLDLAESLGAEYFAKMDDDDHYGPYYLFESLMAAHYSGAQVVGKHACFMHLEADNVTVLRFPDWEHRFTSFVSGPTIVGQLDLAREVRFPQATTGEDSEFLRRVLDAGANIYSASRFGFVQRRSGRPGHTWDITSAEVLATGRITHWGAPNDSELP